MIKEDTQCPLVSSEAYIGMHTCIHAFITHIKTELPYPRWTCQCHFIMLEPIKLSVTNSLVQCSQLVSWVRFMFFLSVSSLALFCCCIPWKQQSHWLMFLLNTCFMMIVYSASIYCTPFLCQAFFWAKNSVLSKIGKVPNPFISWWDHHINKQ